MATDILNAIFEDFNDQAIAAIEAPAEAAPPAVEAVGETRQEAWTDGYLKGRQEAGAGGSGPALSAKLLTSVHELDATTSQAVDAASLAVAGMLVNSVIAAAAGDWSARLIDRVRLVAERIKPALTVAPEFVLRDEDGTIRHFADITDLSRALETDGAGEDVTIKWQRGEATISRSALLEDLRTAIIPLSCGLTADQNARQHT